MGRTDPPHLFALNCLDVLVLVAFAFAQPLFDLLARSAAFLVVHRARPVDLLVLVLCTYALPAGLLIVIEWLAARRSPRIAAAVHLAILGLLLTLDLLPVLRRIPLPGTAVVILALIAGAGLAVAYSRVRTWRWSLVYLSPVVLLFPVILLFFSPASAVLLPSRAPQALAGRIGNPVPIVFLVFDEFPLVSLMDQDGEIDRSLYPNFAALARTAAWYRNLTTVGESTLLALPAMVSGKYPDPANPRLPDAAGHPDTLFTLLGASYRLHVNENNTRLCPERLCGDDARPTSSRLAELLTDAAVLWSYTVLPADLTGRLPDVTQSWKDFGSWSDQPITLEMWTHFDNLTDWHDRVDQFRSFAAAVRPTPWPTLHFLHILLPHAPWEYLPSGQKCTFPEPRIRGLRGINDRGEDPNSWTGDAWAVAQSQQRHLLQVALVDRLVGALLRQLRDNGMYDSSLVIITADHGASFRPGDSRRSVTATNYADIMAVPLFIKYPRQRTGGIDDRPAETIDILPTILEVLKAQAGWKPDGRSLLGAPVARRVKSVVTDAERKFEFPAGPEALRAGVALKLALFRGPGGLYHLGDTYGWIGRPIPAAAAPEPGIGCALRREGYYTNVDLRAPKLVTNLSGRLRRQNAAAPSRPLQLAVAVNGAVAALTWSYRDGDGEGFSALVPDSALRAGRNEIAVFRVFSATELRRIRPAPQKEFEWGTPLQFAAKGNAAAYFGLGWSVSEADLTWTEGHRATLYLPVARPAADIEILANLAAFTHPEKMPAQRTRVLANGHEIANWTVHSEFRDYTARIPRDYVGDVGLEITFELPDAAAPIALGAGSDSRTLGLALTRLVPSLR